ncbi:MAG: excinuclease ABC subunit UvrA [Candidatus Uhrbacteria bacterium]
MSKSKNVIAIRGARVHNLKNVDVDIPKNSFVVITGLSGSGKSSLAFDTVYAEGQRRFMESLSSYARQFLEMQDKPDVDEITGLSPTVAIDQKSSSHNPRSTVGTVTEVYDALRILFARIGKPHCPKCRRELQEQTLEQIVTAVSKLSAKETVYLFAPIIHEQKGEHKQVLLTALDSGFKAVRFDSLMMDTEEALGMRKDKTKLHSIDLLIATLELGVNWSPQKIKDFLAKTLEYGNGTVLTVLESGGEEQRFSQAFYCHDCQLSVPKPEPRSFSFNSPHGACSECTGLGIKLVFEPELVISNKRLTLDEGAIRPWSRAAGNSAAQMHFLETVCHRQKISLSVPVEKIPAAKMKQIFEGTGEETYDLDGQTVTFPGVLALLEKKYKETDSDYVRHELESYMRTMICPACRGQRLKAEALAVKVLSFSIADFVNKPLDELADFFRPYLPGKHLRSEKDKCCCGLNHVEQEVMERVAKEVGGRIKNLLDVGLGYLTLDRSAMTLSGGESQRVRLATQLGSGLTGVIYILDEPSIGLHPRDNQKLIETLKKLRDLGNSVIVVEHDAAMMNQADWIIDVGPGAGAYGGEIIAQGTVKQLAKNKESLTGQYLSGQRSIPVPKKIRKGSGKKLTVVGARGFNLQNVTVDFPLGTLTCVTGVSGSGKSTLILETLAKALEHHFYRAKDLPAEHDKILGLENIDKIVAIDQSPIGRTPRSNPATYTGLFTGVRDLFTEVSEAKLRRFDAGHFSFNVKGGGRCEACGGDGVQRIEMQFMPDVYAECPECHGRRYNAEVLEIHYKGKNIADVLDMTVEEAWRFFSDQSTIADKLGILREVGLGYMRLGQSATTLSGGEAQRVKLATELSRRATGKTLYILDEPTTGLHFEDIKKLLDVLHRLADKGNTVLIIEHNLDVIKGADWIIDMGPDGGNKGGLIMAEGTPKDVAKVKGSYTGQFLKEML